MPVLDNDADFTPSLGSPGSGVVITGGASGIGLAAAHALAAVGRPVALWDINAEGAAGSASIIEGRYGVRAAGLSVDLRNPQAVRPQRSRPARRSGRSVASSIALARPNRRA